MRHERSHLVVVAAAEENAAAHVAVFLFLVIPFAIDEECVEESIVK